MDAERKKIIINEIHYWKENRMLPAQYCDYLLALYTEGGSEGGSAPKKKAKALSWKRLAIFLFLPIFVFFLYFTELSPRLQMALSLIFVIFCLFAAFYYFKKGILFQLSLAFAALVLLLASTESVQLFISANGLVLYAAILANCILWLFAGWRLKLSFFTIAGFLGIILVFIFIFK